jgi:hypothetical protein
MWVVTGVLVIGLCGTVVAQDVPSASPSQEGQEAGRGGRGAFHGVGGQITAIDGSTVTLQTLNGEAVKVRVTSTTRLMKDRNEAKLSDFKIGDRVFASGEQDKDGVWTAQVLGERNGAGGPRGGGMQMKPEDNGKSYIFGELVKIDGTKLTVKKPDNTEQVIEVDDNTSFHNERRESVTLEDMKVGDFVRGQGAVKDGVFVPKQLNAGRTRGARQGMAPVPPPNSAPQSQRQGPNNE